MLRCRLAVFFGALLLATPSYAARCGGSFPAFVQSFSQEEIGRASCRERV